MLESKEMTGKNAQCVLQGGLPYTILTNVRIFQSLHNTYHIIGQHALCGKENPIVREYTR